MVVFFYELLKYTFSGYIFGYLLLKKIVKVFLLQVNQIMTLPNSYKNMIHRKK
jgi:hypothetical protein